MTKRAVSGILLEKDSIVLVGRSGLSGETLWAPPGGKVERGETLQDAVVREFFEETSLVVEGTRVVGYLEVWSEAAHYALWVWLVSQVANSAWEPTAGDDARGLRLQRLSELRSLDLAPGVLEMFDHLELL